MSFEIGDKVVYRKTLICTIVSKTSMLYAVTYGLSVDETNTVAFSATDQELELYKEEKSVNARKYGWITLDSLKK